MMATLDIVDPAFVEQFVATYEALSVTTYVRFSASARACTSRCMPDIPLLGRQGELLIVEPSTGAIRPGRKKDFPKVAPFSSEKEYRAAIKEAGGEVPKEGLRAA